MSRHETSMPLLNGWIVQSLRQTTGSLAQMIYSVNNNYERNKLDTHGQWEMEWSIIRNSEIIAWWNIVSTAVETHFVFILTEDLRSKYVSLLWNRFGLNGREFLNTLSWVSRNAVNFKKHTIRLSWLHIVYCIEAVQKYSRRIIVKKMLNCSILTAERCIV